MSSNDEFSKPVVAGNNSGEGKQQWSDTTIDAAKPNPKWATRQEAIDWNERWANQPKFHVDPDEYRGKIPSVTPEQTELAYNRLRELGRGFDSSKLPGQEKQPEPRRLPDPWER